MNRLIKKLSLLMALCLIAALLPSVSYAASETRTLYYNSSDSLLHYDSTEGEAYSGNTGNWSGNGTTLTLNGFDYTTIADCALVVSGTLNIQGVNTLEASRRSGTSAVTATILSYSSLTITGSGQLNLRAVDDDFDSYPERCIYTYANLAFSGSVDVYAYAEGDAGSRTVDSAGNLTVSGSAKLTSDSKGPHSGWAIFVSRDLSMSGGTIYANSESGDGGGIQLRGNFQILGGEIYAKCLPSGSSNVVAFYGTIPSSIGVSGSDSTSGFNDYSLSATLTKLYSNGAVGAYYRAVELGGVDGAGGAGIPNLNAALKNIKITALPEFGRCILDVEYYESGNLVSSEKIVNIIRGTFITEADLTIPVGYKLIDPVMVTVTSNASIKVNLEKVITYRLTINYVDEVGRQIGSETLTVPKGTVVRDSDFKSIPPSYNIDVGFTRTVTADETVTIKVHRTMYTMTIEYRDGNNWLVGTERIEAAKDTSVTDIKLHPPASYKLKDSFSRLATKDETVVVTVEKSAYILTVQYRDESNWPIGSEVIQVSIDPIVTVTERNLSTPWGYRLKDATFSKPVTKDETVSVTVVRTNSDFNASSWAQEELKRADKAGLIPDNLRYKNLTLPISRAEFAAVTVKVYEALSGSTVLPSVVNPFTDTKDSEVLKAYNLGITNGTSATTFSPDFFLNREQAATMLTRVFKRLSIRDWTLANDSNYTLSYTMPKPFADDASISTWAKNSVYFMVVNNVIYGVGNNMFAPRNTTAAEEAIGYANTTREQAIAIAMRMTQNLKT